MPGSPRLTVSSPSAFSASDCSPTDEAELAPGAVKLVLESARRPGRFAVTLVDGRVFTVPIAALRDTGATRPGVALDAPAVYLLARESAITDVADRALNALARGRKTRRELERRLRRHQPDKGLVGEALDRLAATGVLSDSEVAHAEAAARLRRGEAPARVRQVLRQKGVETSIVQDALQAAIRDDGFDELRACREVAEKRLRALGDKDPVVMRRRLVAYLQRRGFGGREIGVVLREVLASRSLHEDP